MSNINKNFTSNHFTFIDLFSGIGGFRLGLNRVGGQCLNFSEISIDAINTYCANFEEQKSLNLGDITKIKELPKHDLLTAGVPCQSWSIAGKNLGFDDDRGQLWNDTVYLLNEARPKAFIFENVKGLTDPRNLEAFSYILQRIKDAGYYAKPYILNSYDYGVLQNRVRVYIVGFKEEHFHLKFQLPKPLPHNQKLRDILDDIEPAQKEKVKFTSNDLFGKSIPGGRTRFQKHDELNDFFLFNDIRNGHSTVHSWDLYETSDREKEICYFLLRNRRKKLYGGLDGNPLSLQHFQDFDPSISQVELEALLNKGILKRVENSYSIKNVGLDDLSEEETCILEHAEGLNLSIDTLKRSRVLKVKGISFSKNINQLIKKGVLECSDIRYDFRHSKISSGIDGVNRIYLPTSDVFSTLVASDSSDFVALKDISASSTEEFKKVFIEEIYRKNLFRKLTKKEACVIQGFPEDFSLPDSRARWMKLIGNSVSVPVIEQLGAAIVKTGVFDD